MADERRTKLDELTRRRDKLRETTSRLQGRLESARSDLAAVEDECRKKGVPPEKLEAAITELTKRHEAASSELLARIEAAEKTIQPYLGDRG